MSMKTRTTIEFTGTAEELKQLLSEKFTDEQIILSCTLCSDSVMQRFTDPLFRALIDFCAKSVSPIFLNDKEDYVREKALSDLYEAKSLAHYNPIEAIKKIRNSTGLGLSEAKDFVNQYLLDKTISR